MIIDYLNSIQAANSETYHGLNQSVSNKLGMGSDPSEMLLPQNYMYFKDKPFFARRFDSKVNINFLDCFFGNKNKKSVFTFEKKLISYLKGKSSDEFAIFEIIYKNEIVGFIKIVYINKHKNSVNFGTDMALSSDSDVEDEAKYLQVSYAFEANDAGRKIYLNFSAHLEECSLSKEENKHKFKIFTKDIYDGFIFKKVPLVMPKNQDIILNYGVDFAPVHEKIIKNMKEKHKGLYLFRGDPGTGKSTYVKLLSNYVDKTILYIPPNFIPQLESPEFQDFLENERNSIIFIEDAEKIVKSREIDTHNSVLNVILNFTDGWLADSYNISFVLTMNCDKDFLDKALVRKGRLVVDHDFQKLSIDDSQNLIDYLKLDYVAQEPMALTDIYNLAEDNNYKEKKDAPIGFNV